MLRHDLWERVIKPQSRIEEELKKSEKPITSDIKTRPKSKCQKRKKRDSVNGEEPRREILLSTPTSITEGWLITNSQSLLTLSENHRPMTRPDNPTSPPNEEDT